ncbi:MAG: NAD-dependent deacylase [Anaerolineae bacterium]|jgi:NAD-dependent deacetylase|nr:NAD-dependent deacylase [Anaerolineae bacterium]MBT7072785.1 NAD-dependent deacylase [Anaerolineae bacterium]MBT7323788.1 NAD-dependent deacylase [Anaerolineae bacterium]
MEISAELIRFLKKATRIAVLTGAGISAESGLKTFRDAQDGHWSKYRPEDLATPEAFARDPKLVWDWYAMRRNKVAEATPNPSHFALVEMEHRVSSFTLITQNVDGYHRQAGSQNVLELHGNIQQVKCYDGCGVVDEWEEPVIASEAKQSPSMHKEIAASQKHAPRNDTGVPRCEKCGAYLRPDVVWFGESLPLGAFDAALEAAANCHIFFSIGTSGLVQPAASLAGEAHRQGAAVVEVNLDPTPLTPYVDFALHGKSGEILPKLVYEVWG